MSLALGIFRVYLPYYTHQGEEVIVPDVMHIPFDQAVKLLEARGLRVEVVDSLWRAHELLLSVVQQHPKASARVKVNRRIQLWISPRIPPVVVFPDLAYTSPAFARRQLERLDLQPGRMLYQPDLAKDAVIECRRQGVAIQAGDKIHKGAVVDLVIGTAVYTEPKTEP